MTKQHCRLSFHSPEIAIITLDHKRGNIMDLVMVEQLHESLKKAQKKKHTRAVILKAAGDHFSYGAEVKEHLPKVMPQYLRAFHQLVATLVQYPLPVCAVVQGECLGGGMELVSLCPFVFAEEKSRFGQPEIRLGVIAPVASLILPLRLGATRAERLLLTGAPLSAAQAAQWGLVSHLSTMPFENAIAFVHHNILPLSGGALSRAIKAARFGWAQQVLTQLDAIEDYYLKEVMNKADSLEGLKAFLKKKTPQFQEQGPYEL